MKLFVLVAAAAMTLASCQKNEITGPVKKEVNFTIKADMAETKTAIIDNGDGTYRPTWKGGDKIAVLFSEPTKDCNKDTEFVNTNEDGAIAQFEGKHTFETEEGVEEVEGTLYAFYPSSAFNKGYQDGTVRLDLPAVQNPTSTSFDPACDLLVAKPYYYYAAADGDAYDVLVDDMYFARLISVLRINLNSDFLEDEIVKSVSFDADGLRLTGAMAVDPIEGVLVKNNSTTDLSEVQALYTETDPIAVSGEKNSAYLVVAPVTIPFGTTLTFTIETENYDIVKTVSAPSDMIMPAGNIAVINLNIKEEDCAAKTEDTSDFSGEWLIVNTDLTKAASKWVDGKNNLSSVDLTSAEGVVYESDNLADCKMTITKVTEGENAGCYTIQDASNRYLYAASASANRLNARQDASYWDITEKDGIYTIKSKENTTRNWMRFNNSDNIFNCYSSGQQDITLYKYSDIKVDTTPSISLTQNSDQVAFDATSYDFTYTTKNITGNVAATIKEGATMTNVSASASNGTVAVKFNANADAEKKTATIVLSYDGAVSQEFVLTQAGKPAEGGEAKVEVWSWAGGGKANFTGGNIEKTYGLGSDYAASHAPYQIKMDDSGDYFIIKVDGAIKSVSVGVKMIGGATNSTLDVQGSSDGESYSSVEKLTISGSQNAILELQTTKQFDPSYRYLKFYFTKGSNIGVGPISITYTVGSESGGETPETPVEPTLTPRNLTFSAATATATVGQAFNAPTLSGETTGVTYSSSNTAVATVNASTGDVTLVGEGTTTITASAPATEEYEAGEAKYTLTVSEASTKKTYTLTITASDFNGTSYAANNNEKTSKATAGDGSTMDVKWTSNQVMLQSSAMQWQKSKGYIYNSTDLGTIKDITITSSAGTFTKNIGTTQQPTSSGNGGYFKISVGSTLGTTSKVVITFEK